MTNNKSNYRFKTILELEVELENPISCLQYNALLSAIPTDWKAKHLKGKETNLQGKEFQIQHLRIDKKKLSTKNIYQSLAYSKYIPTAANHRLSPLWVRVPQVAILRTCPNMTLAVERDVKPQL